jgi:hypothetical protein
VNVARSDHAAYEPMRLTVETLATGPESIRARVLAAERHFRQVERAHMRDRAEEHLWLRIRAALVEGGPEGHDDEEDDDDLHVAESVADLDEERLTEIAADMLRLYELIARLRADDRHGFVKWP